MRTLYSGISRGTETLVHQGRVPRSEHERMRAPFQEGDFPAPVKYGYINVGIVEDGPDDLLGKTVFCLYPHQTHYVVDAAALSPVPEQVPAERAILAAGMETAVNALWDARPCIGDRVTVVGAGVIGASCAYLLARMPGVEVQLVDSAPGREPLAAALGCEFALPGACVGGADLVIHASGQGQGLTTALGLAGPDASVVELSWYGDQEVRLPLGQAFHSQRLRIASSQVGTIPPHQQARWDYKRRLSLALELLGDSALDGLISGESPFSDLPATLAEICGNSGPLCHRIRYPC